MLEKKISLNRPVILIYENDEEFTHGGVFFWQEETLFSNNFASCKPFPLRNKLLLEKGDYVLIHENSPMGSFHKLIERLFIKFNSISFYCTKFTDKQMAVLGNVIEKNNQVYSLSWKYKFKEESNICAGLFLNKENLKIGELGIHYVTTSKDDLIEMMNMLKTSEIRCLPYSLQELSKLEIETEERRKESINQSIRQAISQNSEALHILTQTPSSLQSIIRAQHFNKASLDEIKAPQYDLSQHLNKNKDNREK